MGPGCLTVQLAFALSPLTEPAFLFLGGGVQYANDVIPPPCKSLQVLYMMMEDQIKCYTGNDYTIHVHNPRVSMSDDSLKILLSNYNTTTTYS